MFSTKALEKGIEDIKKNIKIFEKTIEDERARIDEYQDMIEALKEKATQEKIAKALEKSINGGQEDGNSS